MTQRDLRSTMLLFAVATLLGACAGDDHEMDTYPSSPPVSDPVAVPIPPPDRIDPDRAAEYTNDDYVALGLGRSGLSGGGTTQSNTTLRYVSAARGVDGNDGSETRPWQTIRHAAEVVEPGTTVLVDDSGEYRGGIEIRRGGAAGAYVIFRNRDEGQMPRIAGDGTSEALIDIDASFVVLQGFEIADHDVGGLDADEIAIRIEPRRGDITHVEIRNNVIHDIGPGPVEQTSCDYDAHGILAQADGHRLSGLILDGNEIHHAYVGNSEVLVVNGNVEDFHITSNYIHDVNNIAIDVIGYERNDAETARHGVIADNVVLDASNYFPSCSRGNCTYPAGDESSDGIYVDGGADLVIEHNVVGRADHGIELQSENGQLIRNVTVRRNIVFNSYYRNFTLGPNEGCREHDNAFIDDPTLAAPAMVACGL